MFYSEEAQSSYPRVVYLLAAWEHLAILFLNVFGVLLLSSC